MSFATRQFIKDDKQRVTFATTECIRRRATPPHAKKTNRNKQPRLIESGAVRLQFDAKTNPRRRNKNHIGSHRLIDQGAVRLNITRHTTPRRRLHKSRSQLYSPELTRKKMVPQSDKLYRHNNNVSIAATTSFTPANTPATKKYTPNRRSNAYCGGHRFRASLSPKPPSKTLLHSTPVKSIDTHKHKENNNNNLAFELNRRLVEHSAIVNKQQEETREGSLSRMLF